MRDIKDFSRKRILRVNNIMIDAFLLRDYKKMENMRILLNFEIDKLLEYYGKENNRHQ